MGERGARAGILTKAVEASAKVHGYGTFQLYCDGALMPLVDVCGFGVRRHAARARAGREWSTDTRGAGVGAAGFSYPRAGASAG